MNFDFASVAAIIAVSFLGINAVWEIVLRLVSLITKLKNDEQKHETKELEARAAEAHQQEVEAYRQDVKDSLINELRLEARSNSHELKEIRNSQTELIKIQERIWKTIEKHLERSNKIYEDTSRKHNELIQNQIEITAGYRVLLEDIQKKVDILIS